MYDVRADHSVHFAFTVTDHYLFPQLTMGLACLIATPVARVTFSVWGFAAEHDRMYVIFTVIVIAILPFSLVGSQV